MLPLLAVCEQTFRYLRPAVRFLLEGGAHGTIADKRDDQNNRQLSSYLVSPEGNCTDRQPALTSLSIEHSMQAW